ncbi:hypothetical protein CYMTET_13764 [Cymbomonas tetramitiformis]|uniref:Uncharacterized protein n=1 Tax=Cymbomonas tetramitiformis TaxID=36881 RepID=A0AAE0GHQ4_9CHLO|nr:hypothetical protein CYMTET_13764 [Cymbomonas tetramitiformis]
METRNKSTRRDTTDAQTDAVRIARERYESAKDIVAAIYSKGRHRKWAKVVRQHQLGGDYFGDATDVSKLAKVVSAIKSEISTAGLSCDVFDPDNPTLGVQRAINELLYDTLTYVVELGSVAYDYLLGTDSATNRDGRRALVDLIKERTGLSAYAFAEEAENSVLAARFQHAIDHDDAEAFDALCMLAGAGKPDIFADLSACSFCEEDGGALVYTVHEHERALRDVLSAIEEPESVIDYECETYATSDDDDEGAPIEQPPPRYGCGRNVPGLGRSFLTSSLARYRELRQGFTYGTFYGIIPLPPGTWDPDPHWIPPSPPPYSPPPYSSVATARQSL